MSIRAQAWTNGCIRTRNKISRCSSPDLEGVFLPEIWIAVAERTNLPDLRLTTRDVPDYDQLMHHRMQILERERPTLADIQAVIASMEPLPGAVEFLDWLPRTSGDSY